MRNITFLFIFLTISSLGIISSACDGSTDMTVGATGDCSNLELCFEAINNTLFSCTLLDNDTAYSLNSGRYFEFDGINAIEVQSKTNVTIDCNGSLINMTNTSSNSNVFELQSIDHFNVKNCSLYGGGKSISIGFMIDNFVIQDSLLYPNINLGGSTPIGVNGGTYESVQLRNYLITRNQFFGGGLDLFSNLSSYNNTVSYNQFGNSTYSQGGANIYSYINYSYNNFTNSSSGGSSSTLVILGNNSIIQNNNINGTFLSSNGISSSRENYNITIKGNSIFNYRVSAMNISYKYSTISNNNLSSNYRGINLYGSSNDTLIGNTISNCSFQGINSDSSSSNISVINNTLKNNGNITSSTTTASYKSTYTIYEYGGEEYNSSDEWGYGYSIWLNEFPPVNVIFSVPPDYSWFVQSGSVSAVVNGTSSFDLVLLKGCSFMSGPTSKAVALWSSNIGTTDCASLNTYLSDTCCQAYARNTLINNGANKNYTYNSSSVSNAGMVLKSGLTNPPVLNYFDSQTIISRSYPSITINSSESDIINNTFVNDYYILGGIPEISTGNTNSTISGNYILKGSYETPLITGSNSNLCYNNIGNFYGLTSINSYPSGDCGYGTMNAYIFGSQINLSWQQNNSNIYTNSYDIYSNVSNVLTFLNNTNSTSMVFPRYDNYTIVPWINYDGLRYNGTTFYSSVIPRMSVGGNNIDTIYGNKENISISNITIEEKNITYCNTQINYAILGFILDSDFPFIFTDKINLDTKDCNVINRWKMFFSVSNDGSNYYLYGIKLYIPIILIIVTLIILIVIANLRTSSTMKYIKNL